MDEKLFFFSTVYNRIVTTYLNIPTVHCRRKNIFGKFHFGSRKYIETFQSISTI